MGVEESAISKVQTKHEKSRGGFGKVWKVQYKKTKHQFALKEMSKVKIIDRKSEKSIKGERDFLSQLHHQFIVNMICSFQDKDNLYLVMDLLNGGDLRYHICHRRRFSEEQTTCVLVSLEYIHSNNIIHRDIKPENLVCDENGYIALTDFGVAKKNLKNNSSETSGTPGYMAPEVLCALNHSFPVDFFALGVMGYEFMLGVRPYVGKNRKEIKELVLSRQAQIKTKNIPDDWSEEAVHFINALLQRKPSHRLGYNGISEVKSHPWFIDFDWNELMAKTMKSPFQPRSGDNFDKKYCDGVEKIGTETEERYNHYRNKEKYAFLFDNYTYCRFDTEKIEKITQAQITAQAQAKAQSKAYYYQSRVDSQTKNSSNGISNINANSNHNVNVNAANSNVTGNSTINSINGNAVIRPFSFSKILSSTNYLRSANMQGSLLYNSIQPHVSSSSIIRSLQSPQSSDQIQEQQLRRTRSSNKQQHQSQTQNKNVLFYDSTGPLISSQHTQKPLPVLHQNSSMKYLNINNGALSLYGLGGIFDKKQGSSRSIIKSQKIHNLNSIKYGLTANSNHNPFLKKSSSMNSMKHYKY